MTESDLQVQVAEYLTIQYPDVMFHSDFGSGIKLTPGQAVKQKRQNGGRRAWPDMFIAEPIFEEATGAEATQRWFKAVLAKNEAWMLPHCGLFLELKKEGTRLKRKDGSWANEHIAEQSEALESLRQRGYCAEFAIGFDEAKKIIDEYLGGRNS